MIYKAFVCSLLVSAISAFSDAEYKTAFTNWMQEHQKSYTAVDFQERFANFKDTMDKVESCNTDPDNTYKCTLNMFSDMLLPEFLRVYTGFIPPANTTLEFVTKEVEIQPADPSLRSGADIVNWEAKGAVTPVKNQGTCGSCWSFSVTGATEGITKIKTGKLTSLSEQNLVDCAGSSYGCKGCGGGNPRGAFNYIIQNHGIDTESSYPYTGKGGSCHYKSSDIGATLSGTTPVPAGSEGDLVNHINNQPVAITVDATDNFKNYHSGIFNDKSCSNELSKLDHAILAVGYGSNYYVVKNSWSAKWGMNGYIWMSRGAGNQCGVATYATAPNK